MHQSKTAPYKVQRDFNESLEILKKQHEQAELALKRAFENKAKLDKELSITESAISNKQIELKKLIDTHEDYLTTSSDEIKDKTRSIKDLKEQEGSLIFKIEEYKGNLAGLVEKEAELSATLKSNVTNLENVNLFERGVVEKFFLNFFFRSASPKTSHLPITANLPISIIK